MAVAIIITTMRFSKSEVQKLLKSKSRGTESPLVDKSSDPSALFLSARADEFSSGIIVPVPESLIDFG